MSTCTGAAFAQFLVTQTPKFDEMILQTVRPHDSWIGHVSTGTWKAFMGNTLYQDRFEVVYPDVTQAWNSVDGATGTNCTGNPCDPTENQIGYGATRRTYSPERQSWSSALFCYDQILPVTQAVANFKSIIAKILKPATTTIMSWFLKKRALFWADTKFVTNSTASTFIYVWQNVGTSEQILLTSQIPTSKLTPQFLQRQVQPLTSLGYFGENPYGGKDNIPLIELVTDLDTCWELDRLGGTTGIGGGVSPSLAANWRFTQWDAANPYWRYGLSGQVGNFSTRIDSEQLRFNYAGPSGNSTYPFKFQLVLPFKNVVSSGSGGAAGIKSIPNPDYFLSQYRISFIWHRMAMEVLTAESPSINSEMPFMKRDFGGKWFFAMDNLTCGTDVNGNPIAVDNSRRNKGMFKADFNLAIRPLYTEYAMAIFHKGEPQCLYVVNTCNADPGYPTQSYASSNTTC